ncbi:MAG: PD40 domain-containing protein, partial [Muribaculaceae bacterium]|nr:PD40 domain-containing protein [Muribaculaceae bacterium]
MLAAVAVAGFSACGGAKLSVADEQMARGEYFDAAKTYRKVYNRLTKREERTQRGEVALKMAECYRRLSQFPRASASYQNALRYGVGDSTTTLALARSLHAEGKYAPAVQAYEQYLALDPDNESAAMGLAGARAAVAAKASPSRYVVRQHKLVNSRRSDYAPMLAGENDDVLYYTTTNEKVKGDNRSEITGTKKPDIWVMKKNEQGQWQKPAAVEGELNTEVEEGICSFSPDGNTMYLTRARREPNSSTVVEIFTSSRSDASWSAPQKFEITADTLSSFGHPAVSPSGDWLYFTSDMPGGQGGYDIWRINLKERVGSLENLGEFINTPGNEQYPYVRGDSLLYFASDGHAGMGGLDLFRAQQTPS